jgi:hypothetical protein
MTKRVSGEMRHRGQVVVAAGFRTGDDSATTYSLVTPISVVAGTTRALTQADHNHILDFSSADAVTVTIPTGLTLPYVVGISQGGDGTVTIDPDDGVTVNEIDGNLATGGQYAMMTLTAFAADDYRLFGRTA